MQHNLCWHRITSFAYASVCMCVCVCMCTHVHAKLSGAVQTRQQIRRMGKEKRHNLLAYTNDRACLASHNECLTMATLPRHTAVH